MTKNHHHSDTTDHVIDLAAGTLTGDVRDFLLDRIKTQGKPWAAMTDDEQSDAIHAATEAADRLVRGAVQIIAAEGRKAVVADLESVTVKDGIKAVLTLPKSAECRHELADSVGQTVLVIVADAEPFKGERAPAEPMPSQGDLVANAEALAAEADKVRPLRP